MARQIHAVVLPFPAQGHFSPAIQLARKLAAHGAVVTIVNVDSIHSRFLQTWSCPSDLDIRLEEVPFELHIPEGYDATNQANRLHFAVCMSNLRKPFELLLPRLDPPATCLVADEFIHWPKEVAKNLGLASVSYFPGAASWSSVHHHLDLILFKGDLPLTGKKFWILTGTKLSSAGASGDQLVTYIPGLSPIRSKDLPEYFHYAKKEDLEAYSKIPGHMRDADWVLVNSFYDLEPKAFDAMRQALGDKYLPVGPLFPVVASALEQVHTSLRKEDHECLNWLDSKPASSVLYVSFGSCSRLSVTEFKELADGLKATELYFLWVLPEMFAEKDPSAEIHPKVSESCEGRGLFVPWAPQLKVLAHASTGGFLTHCGWNSTLESICNGVPMLGWPRHSDQDLNCKLIAEWNTGCRFVQKGEALEWNRIQKQVKDFMDVEKTREMRAHLQNLKNAAVKAASEGGSSHSSITALVDHMKSS